MKELKGKDVLPIGLKPPEHGLGIKLTWEQNLNYTKKSK